MPAPTLTLNERKVRKWGRMLVAIADESVAAAATTAAEFFGDDHLPIALPNDHRQMGLVTTDGITAADAITTEGTQMLQSLEDVRTDVTGRQQSLTMAFGESNAWTNALAHGMPVSDWPTEKDGPWGYDDGEISDWPYYRVFLIGQDGVGPAAVYRVEYAYRAKVTAKTDRTMSKANPETFGVTFGLFRDPVIGKSFSRGEDSPSLHTAPAG